MSILDFGEALRMKAIKVWAATGTESDTKISASASKNFAPNTAQYDVSIDIDSASKLDTDRIRNAIVKDLSNPVEQRNLLELRGSPSFLDMINELLSSVLQGSRKDQHSSTPKRILAKIKAPEKAALKQELDATKTLSVGTQLRDTKGRFYSLANLQVLLNSHLQHVISANMGSEPQPGGQRKLLNYRTGRFASSATVERLTQSKQGMITAFYSYMRYPYQTFEPGFAQGSPKTRDPKLLIAKSIREIAATRVANVMRSVSV